MTDLQEQGQILSILTSLWKLACKGQTEPDGNACAICRDNDHQAPECRMNGFNVFKEIQK